MRGARDERLVAQAQEIIEPHQPTHSLGVDDEAFALQLLSDPAIAVEAVGQCDAMDRIANVGVVALWIYAARDGDNSRPRQLCELTQNAEPHGPPSRARSSFRFRLATSPPRSNPSMSAKSWSRHAPGWPLKRVGKSQGLAKKIEVELLAANQTLQLFDARLRPGQLGDGRRGSLGGRSRAGQGGRGGSPVAIFRLSPSWVRADGSNRLRHGDATPNAIHTIASWRSPIPSKPPPRPRHSKRLDHILLERRRK